MAKTLDNETWGALFSAWETEMKDTYRRALESQLYFRPIKALINPQHFPPDPDYPVSNDNQLSFDGEDFYKNIQPETATEMEVPCPRCSHRAAPEHIVRMTSKRGYKCKCWNCAMEFEVND